MSEQGRNPFAINFGKLPQQYIGREIIIDEIVNELEADPAQNQCFMLTGMRGSGKTGDHIQPVVRSAHSRSVIHNKTENPFCKNMCLYFI